MVRHRRPSQHAPLIPEWTAVALSELAARDRDLAGLVDRNGPPPEWAREPGFTTLIHIILEQQVSLASAQAALDRLLLTVDPLTPERFLDLTDGRLLAIGFSRQKARYGRALATAIQSGALDLYGLEGLDDEAADDALRSVPGVGPWTSSIYRMMVLRRTDVWPIGDIALASSVGAVKGLDRRPDTVEMAALGEAWRPWRSVAARLFWHDYLIRRGRPA